MGRGHGHDHRRLAQGELPGAVEQGHPAQLRPPDPGLGGEGLEPRHRLLLIGLVLEPVHAGPALGVVAGGPGEGHGGAAVLAHHPRGGLGDRQRLP